MILGAFILKMRSTGNASLPVSHGRLLHAALLDLVRKYDEDLSERLHNSNMKAFSIGLLNFGKLQPSQGNFHLENDTVALWKVCSLDENLTRLLINIKRDTTFRIGRAHFAIEAMGFGLNNDSDSSICEPDDLVEKSKFMVDFRNFTIHFVTPTTFRFYEQDYPFPRADLMFGSLSEKWNAINDSVSFDSDKLKTIAQQYLVPVKWEGETRRVNLSTKNGVTGFVGSFTFDMKTLPEEYRRIFIVLLEFAQFSGIGRLTGQGLGSVKVAFH